jgi:hypothetical protein
MPPLSKYFGHRSTWEQSAVDTLEQLMHQRQGDIGQGQNLQRLFHGTKGHLWDAANSLVFDNETPKLRIVTGFFIEEAGQAETDGILAAAQMAFFFKLAGVECCVTTDKHCEAVCRAALSEVGCDDKLEVVGDNVEDVVNLIVQWAAADVTHAISIERPGPSFRDSKPYNMMGQEIIHCAPLHLLFSTGSWKKIGIADRGNEIGSALLPSHIIVDDIRNGHQIACRTPADHLLISRVSNWAGYALIASVALLGHNDWPKSLIRALDSKLLEKTLKRMAVAGAVDGITLVCDHNDPTVDGLPIPDHVTMTTKFLNAVKHAVAGRSLVDSPPEIQAQRPFVAGSQTSRGSYVPEPPPRRVAGL